MKWGAVNTLQRRQTRRFSQKIRRLTGIGTHGTLGDKVNADSKKMYSVKEVADLLEVHVNTVHRAIDRGDIPAIKVLSTWRVAGKDLLDMETRARLSAATKRQARAALKDKKEAAQMLNEIYRRYPDLIKQLIRQSPALRRPTQVRKPMRPRPGAAMRQLKSSG